MLLGEVGQSCGFQSANDHQSYIKPVVQGSLLLRTYRWDWRGGLIQYYSRQDNRGKQIPWYDEKLYRYTRHTFPQLNSYFWNVQIPKPLVHVRRKHVLVTPCQYKCQNQLCNFLLGRSHSLRQYLHLARICVFYRCPARLFLFLSMTAPANSHKNPESEQEERKIKNCFQNLWPIKFQRLLKTDVVPMTCDLKLYQLLL